MSLKTGLRLHISKLTEYSEPEIGEIVEIAYDGTINPATGLSRDYTSTGSYKYTVQGWRRVEASESSVVASDFEVRDGDRYYVEHPAKVGAGNTVDEVYSFSGSATGDTSSHSGVGANTGVSAAGQVFTNNPNGSNTGAYGFAAGWFNHNENSAPASRIVLDFGEVVDIVGIEWQGEGNTGYDDPNPPLPISGARDVTLRFASVPFNVTPNGGAGNIANITKEWQNLDWDANQSSPSGLAEYFDLRAQNAGNPISARYFAVDLTTSWDTRNMSVRHILFHHAAPSGELGISATINDTVNSFYIIDGNGNFDISSHTTVNVGADTVMLDRPGKFRFVRDGNKFKCYENQKLSAEANI